MAAAKTEELLSFSAEVEANHRSLTLSKLFNQKALSDGAIQVGPNVFYIHREFVGGFSPVLKSLFKAHHSKAPLVIEIDPKDAPLFELMLRFMYCDRISVTHPQYLSLLQLAVKYKVELLVAECTKVASDVISLTTSCSLLEWATSSKEVESRALVDKCTEIICLQFDEISNTEDFKSLTLVSLKELLARDDLSAEEYNVYTAIKKWISADPTNRAVHRDDLLKFVRFPTMDSGKLADLDKDPWFKESELVKDRVKEALKFQAFEGSITYRDKLEGIDAKRFNYRWFSNVNVKFEHVPGDHVIKEYIIPSNGYYKVTAAGAKADDGRYKTGGTGAIITAVFFLKKGDKLEYLLGGMSKKRNDDTGGAGGTFVAINGRRNPLIVAGGGGGTRGSTGDVDGKDASLTEDGTDGGGTYHSKGASGGEGATGCTSSYGGGGGGFFTDGKPNGSNTNPGIAFVNGGAAGGSYGGWGGGGDTGSAGGGGGGGYSGGGAGQGAGGGGSFVREDGGDVEKAVGWKSHGYLTIVSARKPKVPGKKLGT